MKTPQIEALPGMTPLGIPEKRSLSTIAREIRRLWAKPYFGAIPYLNAMHSMHEVSDQYGYDDGRSIVNYFLSNAASWRGPDAKRIKAELKSLVSGK